MLLAALLCYLGFAALCLSMPRHYVELCKGPLTERRRLNFKLIGWGALLVSPWSAVNADGWAIGLVQWFAVLMASAVLLVSLMPFRPRWVLMLFGYALLLSPLAALDQMF
ncbi:DUF3325 domain-containing protein [Pseudomonas alliivorans]|uniref:DUF3325 domain-containing protein n=1 Tax=Pseudomonas viridiflava TaxID=33069 RepID=UPI000C0827E1|nr:DUF3325 domain-containing protein [Pseudomonas viridiflava]MEE4375064.1 DUF3325 domain-containing protein [Pseudomonas alliivorans]MEE4663393.1 DUF3325 domain-containing protein [Pseudomonas alliivorans]MEE4676676.1 DUF3325 domain-containing protein [Pseudomonas alliivorans]MEE4702783.1 DUF3325 domain-containing protein [Pseudomonas alliivorans]MEE4717988.1 DUF3325 domain-containing protein [Pseudomonas alliivorans]